MGFSLESSEASLKHINVRKEGPEDSKILAVDLKMEVIAPASSMKALVGDEDDIVAALFDADGHPRFISLGKLEFHSMFKGHELNIAGLRFFGVTLKKFSAVLRDELDATLTFQAQVEPTGKEVAILSEYVQEEMRIQIVPPPELDFGEPKGEPVERLESVAADDPLYKPALDIVLETRRASISGIQRRLQIGYNRAARIVERLEHEGVVSPIKTDGSREVLHPSKGA